MNDIDDEGWRIGGLSNDPGRIAGRCVGHGLTIAAPPELVWAFVTDFAGWPSWSPLYTSMAGLAHEGAQVRFCVQLEGLKPQTGKARITRVVHNELLEYAMSMLGGLLKVVRYIEIEELSPTRCRVVNAEIMGGLLGGAASRMVSDKVARGLQGMNEGLKAVSERKWRERAG